MKKDITAERDGEQKACGSRITYTSITALDLDERIAVWDDQQLLWTGTVDMVDDDRGLLWMYTDLCERKLVDIREFVVLREHICYLDCPSTASPLQYPANPLSGTAPLPNTQILLEDQQP